MIGKYKHIIFIILSLLFLTGCWDYKDINKREVAIAIGADYMDDGIKLVSESAKISSPYQDNKKQIDTYENIAIGGEFDDARASYDAREAFQFFTGAVRCIVCSQRYGEKGIEPYINRINSIVGFRNSVLVVISEQPTEMLFRKEVANDISVGYAIQDTIKNMEDEGTALYKTVQNIKSDIDFKNIGYLLPYVTVNNNVVEYLGMAVMKNSKLIGTIKREESSGFLLMLSEKPVMAKAFTKQDDTKNLLSVKTMLRKRSIKTKYEDKKIDVYIDLKLKAQLQYEYYIQPLSKENVKKVEDDISDKIKESVLSAVKRSQKEFKSDVFSFARYFKAEHPNEYKNMDWEKEYPDINFHVNVSTTIINTNLIDPNAKKPN